MWHGNTHVLCDQGLRRQLKIPIFFIFSSPLCAYMCVCIKIRTMYFPTSNHSSLGLCPIWTGIFQKMQRNIKYFIIFCFNKQALDLFFFLCSWQSMSAYMREKQRELGTLHAVWSCCDLLPLVLKSTGSWALTCMPTVSEADWPMDLNCGLHVRPCFPRGLHYYCYTAKPVPLNLHH